MHGGVSDPSFCVFIHRVAFEEVSGHQVLMKSGPGYRGRSAFGTTHVGCLEFPHETGLILKCAAKVMKLFQTKQRNRPSCGNQEGRSGSDEVLLGTSVFPSSETGMSGNFWGHIKHSKYRFALQKNPMPGHLFEGNPVDEDKKRRVTDTPVHRLEKPADSTHSLTRGLKPHEQLERQAEFHSSEKT